MQNLCAKFNMSESVYMTLCGQACTVTHTVTSMVEWADDLLHMAHAVSRSCMNNTVNSCQGWSTCHNIYTYAEWDMHSCTYTKL